MREELNSIDPLKLRELDKTMTLFTETEAGPPEGDPPWLIDGKINEARFAGSYLANHPMKCVKEVLYGMDGIIDEKELENDIYKAIKAYTVKDVAKLVKNLISVLKIEAYSPELPLDLGHIHFSNGTYCLEDESFTEKKVFCRNRLPSISADTKWDKSMQFTMTTPVIVPLPWTSRSTRTSLFLWAPKWHSSRTDSLVASRSNSNSRIILKSNLPILKSSQKELSFILHISPVSWNPCKPNSSRMWMLPSWM